VRKGVAGGEFPRSTGTSLEKKCLDGYTRLKNPILRGKDFLCRRAPH